MKVNLASYINIFRKIRKINFDIKFNYVIILKKAVLSFLSSIQSRIFRLSVLERSQ
jgi:hypothetical protein